MGLSRWRQGSVQVQAEALRAAGSLKAKDAASRVVWCCTSAARASRMRLMTQLLARTGRETGRTWKHCRATWSATASSHASLEALWRSSAVVGEAPCC